MRSRIFSLVLAPVLLAAVALASNSAKAQARLNVPFSFIAGGRICPVGVYVVRSDARGSFVTLANYESRQNFAWILGVGAVDPTGNTITLRFDTTGSYHTLRSIQYGLMVTSRLDGKSAGGKHALPATEIGQ